MNIVESFRARQVPPGRPSGPFRSPHMNIHLRREPDNFPRETPDVELVSPPPGMILGHGVVGRRIDNVPVPVHVVSKTTPHDMGSGVPRWPGHPVAFPLWSTRHSCASRGDNLRAVLSVSADELERLFDQGLLKNVYFDRRKLMLARASLENVGQALPMSMTPVVWD